MSEADPCRPARRARGDGCESSVIVALDFARPADALALALRLDPARCRVKVGKELFVRGGPQSVRALQRAGFEVFLDLKFHDIPNTVAGACRAAAELGVWMVNVHASGGRRMLAAARAALDDARPRPLLVGVTVLTSLAREELVEVGVSATPAEAATRLARLASECGLDGVVCAARDLGALSAALPPSFLRVTPGIRPAGAPRLDQRRVMTPREALAKGAHYLVIGRPITAAPDPMAALAAVQSQIVKAS